jgi:hypothetical protein
MLKGAWNLGSPLTTTTGVQRWDGDALMFDDDSIWNLGWSKPLDNPTECLRQLERRHHKKKKHSLRVCFFFFFSNRLSSLFSRFDRSTV